MVLLLKIQKIQEQQCLQSAGLQRGDGAHSLQYLTTFAVDLAKLINIAYERANLSKEGLRELLVCLVQVLWRRRAGGGRGTQD